MNSRFFYCFVRTRDLQKVYHAWLRFAYVPVLYTALTLTGAAKAFIKLMAICFSELIEKFIFPTDVPCDTLFAEFRFAHRYSAGSSRGTHGPIIPG